MQIKPVMTHLCNQMTTLLDQAHQLPHVRAPVIQNGVATPRGLEVDDPGGTIDAGVDRLVDYKTGEELFSLGGSEVEEGR